jgi:Spy/CpxP family protein refolding chaperone
MNTLKVVRNITLGTMISIAALSTASAQRGCGGGPGDGRGMHSEEKMEQRAERLKIVLDLTPEQEAKVKELQQKHAKEAEAARAKMQEERTKRQEAHKAEMKAILSPEQFVKYEAMRCGQGQKSKGKGKGKK